MKKLKEEVIHKAAVKEAGSYTSEQFTEAEYLAKFLTNEPEKKQSIVVIASKAFISGLKTGGYLQTQFPSW